MGTNSYKTDNRVEDWDDLLTRVVMEVAQTKDIDPLDLDPLHEVVDPDALDELVTRSTRGVRIKFEYEGLTITVHGSGHVHVE